MFRYFFPLDKKLNENEFQFYIQSLGDTSHTTFDRHVALLKAKIPVPPKVYLSPLFPGFTGGRPTQDLFEELSDVILRLEQLTFMQFGQGESPLLLSIQGDFCGAVRNIGASLRSLKGMIHRYGAPIAFTLYVDFLESYSSLVLGCPHTDFRKTFSIEEKRTGGAGGLANLTEEQFVQYVHKYQNLVSNKIGRPFPEVSEKHLISTLFHCARVEKDAGGREIMLSPQFYQSQYGSSLHGVAYTRNPFTGGKDIYGAYQTGTKIEKAPLEPNREDVVGDDKECLRNKSPNVFALLKKFLPEIEAIYKDVIETEFVSDEDGNLYFTGFEKAQTTAKSTIVGAVELALDGKITDYEAVARIRSADVEVLLHPTLDDASRAKLKNLGSTGVTAAPGTDVGAVFFKMSEAISFYRTAIKNKTDSRVILITDELLISDTPGLGIIKGLVTKTSGIASHAAVMARANGIPCIVGYKGLDFDLKNNSMVVNGKKIPAGTLMTLEAGAIGQLFLGEGKLQNLSYQEGIIRDVSKLISRVLKSENVPVEVRVNINNSKDAQTGLYFGASAVGLCRTENMFMSPEALQEIRSIVFTQNPEDSKANFEKLEEMQYEDYRKIFEVMGERVVNIRLMDLPLHDFAPQTEADFNALTKQLPHLDRNHLSVVAESLKEHNPMLGLRACRFGLITPEVYDMQIRAITRAAYAVAKQNINVNPGIMFPLVCTYEELTRLKTRVVEIEEKIRNQLNISFSSKLHFRVGTMIELPAAALGAGELAKLGEFFAFGTNDLSQTTLGMSRDDSAHYLPFYIEKGILPSDPFKVLSHPVRELIQIAVQRGHRVRKDASFGICGEQGGDKATLEFCLEKGLDYVSCSPFRVLPTKVALAHIALAHGGYKGARHVESQEHTTHEHLAENSPTERRSVS